MENLEQIEDNKLLIKLAMEAGLKSSQDYMGLCDLCGIKMPELMKIIDEIKGEDKNDGSTI